VASDQERRAGRSKRENQGDPDADVIGQLRATLAFDALHHASTPIPGIEATYEELQEAALMIALGLVSSHLRDNGRP
jgi:beta-phosphoglucomutase-like phosphatase (HAD superfamily)